MRRIVISRTFIQATFAVAATVIIGLVIINVIQQGRALDAVARETDRATAVEKRIVQDTVNAISRVARQERLTACVNDEQVRAAARALLVRFGIPQPAVFRPRNCVKVADRYARELRETGPLTTDKEIP